jgi:hypothetical protein
MKKNERHAAKLNMQEHGFLHAPTAKKKKLSRR